MKKIMFIAIMTIFIFACSEDDTTELLQPTIENIKLESVANGDIITIPGKDFNKKGTYSVKFNEEEGKVTEIKSTYLKVEVPENATSGDITLMYDGITSKIGSIVITKFPTVESITYTKVKVGEIITIKGTDFIINEDYTVDFQGVEGKVTEVNPLYLKVEVPEGAKNGDITLTYKDESKVVGSVGLEEIIKISKLYSIKIKELNSSDDDYSTQLVLIDPSTGNEKIVLNIEKPIYYPVYDNMNNIIYGVHYNEDTGVNLLYQIDIENKSFTKKNLEFSNNSQYVDYELVVGKEGALYAIKVKALNGSDDDHSTQLISIDPSTGNETIILNIDKPVCYPVYDNVNNHIYAIHYNEDTGVNQLYQINIVKKSFTGKNLEFSNNSQYVDYELVVGKEGVLYGIKVKALNDSDDDYSTQLISIDPSTGNETIVLNIDKPIYDPVYDYVNNIIYGNHFDEDTGMNQLYQLNMGYKSFTKKDLEFGTNSAMVNYELVIGY